MNKTYHGYAIDAPDGGTFTVRRPAQFQRYWRIYYQTAKQVDKYGLAFNFLGTQATFIHNAPSYKTAMAMVKDRIANRTPNPSN